jgi:hypothetical protein
MLCRGRFLLLDCWYFSESTAMVAGNWCCTSTSVAVDSSNAAEVAGWFVVIFQGSSSGSIAFVLVMFIVFLADVMRSYCDGPMYRGVVNYERTLVKHVDVAQMGRTTGERLFFVYVEFVPKEHKRAPRSVFSARPRQ